MNHELIEILAEAEKTFREYAETGNPNSHDFARSFHEAIESRPMDRTRTDWLRLADNCKRLRESLASGGLSLNVGLEVVS